jgi:hypothetical protein
MVEKKKQTFMPVELYRPINADDTKTIGSLFKLTKSAKEKIGTPYGIFFFFNDDKVLEACRGNQQVEDGEEIQSQRKKADISNDVLNRVLNYRKSLRRTLRKMLGIDAKLNEYNNEVEIFHASQLKVNLIHNKNTSFIARKRDQYNIYGDKVADMVLNLTQAFYYKLDGRTLEDRDDKILEESYKKAIEICTPIKTALDNLIEEEFSVSDNLTNALKGVV